MAGRPAVLLHRGSCLVPFTHADAGHLGGQATFPGITQPVTEPELSCELGSDQLQVPHLCRQPESGPEHDRHSGQWKRTHARVFIVMVMNLIEDLFPK